MHILIEHFPYIYICIYMCISSIVVDGTLSWTQGRKLREQKHSKGPRLVGAV